MKAQILGLSFVIAILGITSTSFAQENKFDRTHPRRAEVNARLKNQDRRIHQEVKEGHMSRRQASRLHRADRRIRREERRMAARNHGHITARQKARLNRQENRVSRKIGQ